MKYKFIEGHRQKFPTRLMCRALEVSAGGYYQWRRRPPSARQERGEALAAEIKVIHREVKARYGSPRIHAELVARGEPCCVNTVAKLMRQLGVAAKTKRKFRCTTDSNHDRPIAENIVDRQFEPEAPNQVWTADITYIPTREGWLYLAAVEDLYSRQVVGWSMSERIDSRLVVDALEMAVSRRLPREGLVAHSDRGRPRDHLPHEPPGELLGQRPDRVVLREPEEGTGPRRGLLHEGGGQSKRLRIHRGLLY
jgi:putative transposase